MIQHQAGVTDYYPISQGYEWFHVDSDPHNEGVVQGLCAKIVPSGISTQRTLQKLQEIISPAATRSVVLKRSSFIGGRTENPETNEVFSFLEVAIFIT